jgi:hypothetical protein
MMMMMMTTTTTTTLTSTDSNKTEATILDMIGPKVHIMQDWKLVKIRKQQFEM